MLYRRGNTRNMYTHFIKTLCSVSAHSSIWERLLDLTLLALSSVVLKSWVCIVPSLTNILTNNEQFYLPLFLHWSCNIHCSDIYVCWAFNFNIVIELCQILFEKDTVLSKWLIPSVNIFYFYRRNANVRVCWTCQELKSLCFRKMAIQENINLETF